ncbi:dymeclin [Anaeramoeba ignava]|uniref:Dymeclin n=1 Tax=Anaeramoeba ignava TaxID=1746090 RepID=A0A9Q0R918_ANAIG|nr:dymeclin [Anaeramoeba ignava]
MESIRSSSSLALLTGKVPISLYDEKFWEQFFNEFHLPLSKLKFVSTNKVFLQEFFHFIENNLKTENLQKLIYKGIEGIRTLNEQEIKKSEKAKKFFQTTNLLFLIKMFIHMFLEVHLSHKKMDDSPQNPFYSFKTQNQTTSTENGLSFIPKPPEKTFSVSSFDDIFNTFPTVPEKILQNQNLYQPSNLENHFYFQLNKKEIEQNQSILQELIETLSQFLLSHTMKNLSDYIIQIEAISILIILLSSEIYSSFKNTSSLKTSDYYPFQIQKIFFSQNQEIANSLISLFLLNIISQKQITKSITFKPKISRKNCFIDVDYSTSTLEDTLNNIFADSTPVATFSLSFILALLQPTHFGSENTHNPYQDALSNITNFQGFGLSDFSSLQIPFNSLLKIIFSKENMNEQMLLLAFHLLSKNSSFLQFSFSTSIFFTCIENLIDELYQFTKIEPQLKDERISVVHLILVVLLVWSQDQSFGILLSSKFSQNLSHRLKTKHLSKLSLGNLLILFLLELAKSNLENSFDMEFINIIFSTVHNLACVSTEISVEVSCTFCDIINFLTSKILSLMDLDQNQLENSEDNEDEKRSLKEIKQYNKIIEKFAKEKTSLSHKIRKNWNKHNQLFKNDEKYSRNEQTNHPTKWNEIKSYEFFEEKKTERPKRTNPIFCRNVFVEANILDFSPKLAFYSDILTLLCDTLNFILVTKLRNNIRILVCILIHCRVLFLFEQHPRIWKFVHNLKKLSKIFQFESLEHDLIKFKNHNQIVNKFTSMIPTIQLELKGLHSFPLKIFRFQDNSSNQNFLILETWSSIGKYSSFCWNL